MGSGPGLANDGLLGTRDNCQEWGGGGVLENGFKSATTPKLVQALVRNARRVVAPAPGSRWAAAAFQGGSDSSDQTKVLPFFL